METLTWPILWNYPEGSTFLPVLQVTTSSTWSPAVSLDAQSPFPTELTVNSSDAIRVPPIATLDEFVQWSDRVDPDYVRIESQLRAGKIARRSGASHVVRCGDENAFALTRPGKLEISGSTHFGNEIKRPNEDAFAIVFSQSGMRYHLVADGVGGSLWGDLAARIYVQTLATRLKLAGAVEDATALAAINLRRELGEAILQSTHPDNLPQTALLVSEYWTDPVDRLPHVHFYHSGDARAVVYAKRSSGRFQEIFRTRDHSLVQEIREASSIIITDHLPIDTAARDEMRQALCRIESFSQIMLSDLHSGDPRIAAIENGMKRLHQHLRPHVRLITLHPVHDHAFITELAKLGLLILDDEQQRCHVLANRITATAGIDGTGHGPTKKGLELSRGVPLHSGSVVIEATDGLWDNLTPADVADIISKCTSAHEMRVALFQEVRKRMLDAENILSRLREARRESRQLRTQPLIHAAAIAQLDAEIAGLLEKKKQIAAKLDNITIVVTLIP